MGILKLVKYELYKLINKKSLCMAVIIILSYLIFVTAYAGIKNKDWKKEYNKYKPYEGKITLKTKTDLGKISKVNDLENENNTSDGIQNINCSESKLINDYKLAIMPRRVNLLSNGIDEFYTKKDLEEEIRHLKLSGKVNTYEYKNFNKALNMLSNITEPKLYYLEAWSAILDGVDFLNVLIISGLILLGVSSIFSEDYILNTISIIKSSKYGNKQFTLAKLFTVIIYSVFIVFITNLLYFITCICFQGIKGYNAPIQNLFRFRDCPYNFTVFKFYSAELGIQTLAAILLGLIVAILSLVTRSSLMTFFIGGIIFIYPVVFKKIIGVTNNVVDIVCNFSILSFLRGCILLSPYRTYNLFNKPIMYFNIALAIIVGMIFILSFILTNKSIKNK